MFAGLFLGFVAWSVPPVVSGLPSDQAALEQCAGILPIARDFGRGVEVARGELSSVGDVVDWQRTRHEEVDTFGDGLLSGRSRSTAAAVCLFTGSFDTPTGPIMSNESIRPSHTLLRLIVLSDGEVVFDAAGYVDGNALWPQTPGDAALTED